MRTNSCPESLCSTLRLQFSISTLSKLRAIAFLVICLLGIGAPAGASVDEQEAAEPITQPSHIHRSPRAVLEAFMTGMRSYTSLRSYEKPDLDLALSCFQNGAVILEDAELERLGTEFYEALRRMTWVELEKIKEPHSGSASDTWPIMGLDSDGEPQEFGVVEFIRISEGGAEQSANWRFAPSVLERTPGWFEDWKDEAVRKEYAAEIRDSFRDKPLFDRLAFQLRESMPDAMRQHGFLLENWQWMGLAALAFVGAMLGRIVNYLLRRLSERVARSERIVFDKSVLVGFERPFGLFVMAWIIFLMLPALHLEVLYFGIVRLAIALFLAVVGVWSAYRLVDVGAGVLAAKAKRTSNRFDDMLVPLVRRMAKIFLTFIGIVFVASYVSEDLYGIVAGLSIGSLAIGFAAKDSIENLFGTVTVLLDQPFQLGDWITVGEIDGTVEEVGFRSTKVRTFYNSIISVPNSNFISAHIDNWGSRRYRRIKTTVGLAYDTPPLKIESFCEALRELVRTHPYTRKDYYHIYLNNFGPSSLDILVYCFVETPDWSTELREKHRLYLDILRVADGLGIEIAFPTQTLHIHQDPADPGPKGSPGPAPDSRGAERMGRELANLIVKEGLGEFDGAKPPPVTMD
ncbi:MAG: MscS family membrane protein [Planctomycetota bacterium]|jgi:MscS family membrane protein